MKTVSTSTLFIKDSLHRPASTLSDPNRARPQVRRVQPRPSTRWNSQKKNAELKFYILIKVAFLTKLNKQLDKQVSNLKICILLPESPSAKEEKYAS